MPCMDGIASKTWISNVNLSNLRTYTDQIRRKHSLTAISWSSLPAVGVTDQAAHLNEVENAIRRFNESEYIGTVTGLPTITVGELIKLQDLTVTDAKLWEINQICVEKTSDFTSHRDAYNATDRTSDYTTARGDYGSEQSDSEYGSCDSDYGSTNSVDNEESGYDNLFNSSDGYHGCSEEYDNGTVR